MEWLTIDQLKRRASDKRERSITADELAAIEARAHAATEGPWRTLRETDEFGTLGMPVVQMYRDEKLVVGHSKDWGSMSEPVVDAEFIAHAREDVPRLAAEVRRIRSETVKECVRLIMLRATLTEIPGVHEPLSDEERESMILTAQMIEREMGK